MTTTLLPQIINAPLQPWLAMVISQGAADTLPESQEAVFCSLLESIDSALVSRAAGLSRGPSTFQSGQKSCQNLEKGFRGIDWG
jgi:hypothetical protein